MEKELKQQRMELPPGPRGTWRPTLALIRNPRAAMEQWVARFGDPFFFHALNGPVVVTGREDLIRAIHAQDPDSFATFASQTTGGLLGGQSVFVMDGPAHRRERRMLTPLFHGDRMRAYGPAMQQITKEQLAARQGDPVISTQTLMTDISLEVIVRSIFGGDNPELVRRMMTASRRVVRRASPLLFFTRWSHFRFLGISPLDRWRTALSGLEALYEEATKVGGNRAEREDFLALLCQARDGDGQPLSQSHVWSELTTFMFAGHETTALTLTWAIYHLHRNPHTLEKLRAELDALPDHGPDSLTAAPYLKAVIQETLRINPIVTETLRKLKQPMELDGYQLPAGMGVALATVLAHYNDRSWTDPDRFNPDRFLERSYSPFVYMPFGGGHRRCLGAAFASYEMAVVLGTMLGNYSFELVDEREVVPKRRAVTMGPSSEVPIRLTGIRNRASKPAA